MHIPNSNLTEGKVTLNTKELHSFYDEAEVIIAGNPKAVTSPVRNGTRLTPADRVRYMFPVSAPWPCPFDTNQCPNGLTLSIWFRWEYFVIIPRQRRFFSLGNSMYLYRPNKVNNSLLSLKWVVNTRKLLYSGLSVTPGQWTHILWVVNTTHAVWYRDGLKGNIKAVLNKALPRGLGRKLSFNEALDMGTFSVGAVNMWAGRRSPVFMWRLCQEGLRNRNARWIA